MEKSKYEIRSTEVQEILNKPPNTLIIFGNLFIILIICIILGIISQIQIPNKIRIPFRLNVTSNSISILPNILVPKGVKSKQRIYISFESYPIEKYGSIESKIDTIITSNKVTYLFTNNIKTSMISNTNKIILLQNNQLGVLEITLGTKNIFSIMKSYIYDSK